MRHRIVSCARGWIGTPYLHQAAVRGLGCDCLGMLRGVWAEVTGTALIAVPIYTPDWSEPQGDEVLLQAARRLLVAKTVSNAEPGDVVVFRMRAGAVAKHVGLQADAGQSPSFIHAYQGHGVVENALTPPWQRRIVARFAFPTND